MPPETVPIHAQKTIVRRSVALGLATAAVIAAVLSVLNFVLDVATSDDKEPLPDSATATTQPKRTRPVLFDTTNPDYEAITLNDESMDDGEPDVLPPEPEVAALDPLSPETQSLITETVVAAGTLLDEDGYLRSNYDSDTLEAWLDDTFRFNAPMRRCTRAGLLFEQQRFDDAIATCTVELNPPIISDEAADALDMQTDVLADSAVISVD
ncbi:MAG: hypothetical protein NUV56_01115 [Candidatus Uhrbacteria bacterium]|nr:hypothetical protein [Candidatus Uhrbacteria bacterium]